MHSRRTPTARLAAALAATLPFAAPLAAQAADSEGPLMVIAHSFSVDGPSAIPGAGVGTLLFTESTFSDTAPGSWIPVPGMPDWSTVLDGLPLDLDAVAIGFDYIQSTPGGFAVIPPGHWAAITFSVTRATTGVAGSLISAEVAAYGGAAADVFSYVLPGSALPPQLVDRTMRSQDSTEISADAPGAPGNIDAHDIYLSLFFHENPQLVPILPFVSVFFSVSKASVPSVPASWWGTAPASGATILRRDWTGAAWNGPYPAFTPASLGLGAVEDVDALAVDVIRGHVLFSTTRPSATPGAPLRNPVLYHAIGTTGHAIYRTSAGVPVSVRLGLDVAGGIDDVDGVCALDPGAGSQPRLDGIVGTPQPTVWPPAPSRVGASAFRRHAQSGANDEFVSWLSGWPVQHTPTPGLALSFIALATPSGPYIGVAGRLRPDPAAPGVPFRGHPERFVLSLPPSPAFLGLDVFFAWAVLDGTSLDVSLPVGIRV